MSRPGNGSPLFLLQDRAEAGASGGKAGAFGGVDNDRVIHFIFNYYHIMIEIRYR